MRHKQKVIVNSRVDPGDNALNTRHCWAGLLRSVWLIGLVTLLGFQFKKTLSFTILVK